MVVLTDNYSASSEIFPVRETISIEAYSQSCEVVRQDIHNY